ncbi:MAG: CinA family protein [Opitutaceae bacterium]
MRPETLALAARLRPLLAAPPRLTLAVAESLTCGRLQAAIGSSPGASEFFLGGITAYAISEKVRHLEVDGDEAERCEAVSASIARQMAAGACRLFGSDLAVSTTGFAEPRPERGFASPAAFFAIARRHGARAEIVHEGFIERPGAGRIEMQDEVVCVALTALEKIAQTIRDRSV